VKAGVGSKGGVSQEGAPSGKDGGDCRSWSMGEIKSRDCLL